MEIAKQKVSAILHSPEFDVTSFKETLFESLQNGEGKYIIYALLHAESDFSSEDVTVRDKYLNIVQLLVNKVENVNFCCETQRTVLHYASIEGWIEVVQTLLDEGADLNARDANSITPLFTACVFSRRDVADLLINSGADISGVDIFRSTLLSQILSNGWLDMAQYLLKHGADPNGTITNNITLLQFAVLHGHKELVMLLISFGVNVNDSNDPTPLQLAVACSNKEIVVLLIEAGANVNLVDTTGQLSPLIYAIEIGCLGIVQYLVENGADIKDTSTGVSPLHYACVRQHVEMIEYLVETINIKDGCDDTPLSHIIQKYPKLSLIRSVIKRGAYLELNDYCRLLEDPTLKEGILQNIQYCTQLILNNFNNKDLPKLYMLLVSADKLPFMEQLLIRSPGMVQDIEQSVKKEIERKGHCNVIKPETIVLRILLVQSLINYYEGLGKNFQLNRSAVVDSDSQPQSSR